MHSNLRVLIVEDTMISREFLKMLMEQRGECVCVGTGEQAVEVFSAAVSEGRPFDLVFLDLMLPGMDGHQTLETMRAIEDKASGDHECHVLVITALDDDASASRAFIHGKAVSYITKPIREEKLEEELQSLGLAG